MGIPVHIPAVHIDALIYEASERNVTAITLASAILSVVVKDEMVDAVLDGIDLSKYATDRPFVTARAEEVLSYFQGLAPVGDEIEFKSSQAVADLRVTRQGLHNLIAQLMFVGCLELVDKGRGMRRSIYRVTRRLESLSRCHEQAVAA